MTEQSVPAAQTRRPGHLADLLDEAARRWPETTAWIHGEQRLTYAQLQDLVARAAGLLRQRGVTAGDAVALVTPNSLTFPVVFFATVRLGAVVVPLNPQLTARELDHHFSDSDVRLVWTQPGLDAPGHAAGTLGIDCLSHAPADLPELLAGVEPVADPVPRDPGDDALLIYTSGTTGKPKPARLTHMNVRASAISTVESLTKIRHGDVLYGALPFFHVFGFCIVLTSALVVGATISATSRFEPRQALEQFVRDGVTVAAGVPTIWGALVSAARTREAAGTPADLSGLRRMISGGASLPLDTLRAVESLVGVPLSEGYGLSEGCGAVCINPVDVPNRPGTVGLPMDGMQFRIVVSQEHDDGTVTETVVPESDTQTVGELRMRGEAVMPGYRGDETATAAAFDADGWLRSGDLARRDEAGYYVIVDRQKDIIITGGYNVYPREVEEVLYEHPAVVEAAVVGRPSERYGEDVVAHVALAQSVDVTPSELLAFLRERLARYKTPREVFVHDALPKNAAGKIVKGPLR